MNIYPDATKISLEIPSLHCAPNHKSLDIFRGFYMSELGMDILKALQVKSYEIVQGFMIWSMNLEHYVLQ